MAGGAGDGGDGGSFGDGWGVGTGVEEDKDAVVEVDAVEVAVELDQAAAQRVGLSLMLNGLDVPSRDGSPPEAAPGTRGIAKRFRGW